MLTEQEIAEIEMCIEDRYNNCPLCRLKYMAADKLLADRAELAKEIERLKKTTAHWLASKFIESQSSDITRLQADLITLTSERSRLQAEVERLKQAYIENTNEHFNRGVKLEADRDRLQAENDALKRAMTEHTRDENCVFHIKCFSCKRKEAPSEDCDSCDNNFSGWVFDYDRFKDGGDDK